MRRLEQRRRAIQAYYSVLNASDSPVAALRYAALSAVHYLRPLGRAVLGLSCGLKGNGMCFSADVLRTFLVALVHARRRRRVPPGAGQCGSPRRVRPRGDGAGRHAGHAGAGQQPEPSLGARSDSSSCAARGGLALGSGASASQPRTAGCRDRAAHPAAVDADYAWAPCASRVPSPPGALLAVWLALAA